MVAQELSQVASAKWFAERTHSKDRRFPTLWSDRTSCFSDQRGTQISRLSGSTCYACVFPRMVTKKMAILPSFIFESLEKTRQNAKGTKNQFPSG
jgi:hypothetical protein